MKNQDLKVSIYVANSILVLAKKQKIEINPIKLYNMVYLVYGEYLYETKNKLFNELFEVTKVGPVLPSILYKFNCYDDSNIKFFAANSLGNIKYYRNEKIYGDIVNKILNEYKDYSKEDIIQFTTNENSAYFKAKLNNNLTLTDIDILNEVIFRKNNEVKRQKKYVKQ